MNKGEVAQRYKKYGYRLNDGTHELFSELKLKKGITYNKLLWELLQFYISNTKQHGRGMDRWGNRGS